MRTVADWEAEVERLQAERQKLRELAAPPAALERNRRDLAAAIRHHNKAMLTEQAA